VCDPGTDRAAVCEAGSQDVARPAGCVGAIRPESRHFARSVTFSGANVCRGTVAAFPPGRGSDHGGMAPGTRGTGVTAWHRGALRRVVFPETVTL